MNVEVLQFVSNSRIRTIIANSPSVSKVAVGLMRVHMMGVRFIAVAIARTRLLSDDGRRQLHTTPHEDQKYILNIAIRRSHEKRLNTKNIVNNFFGPAKFGDDLFIRQSSK